jgi:hypothetical protein
LFQQPACWYESARFRRKIESQPIEPDLVFVIGHWRSGTTHLQNVLCQDPQFGRVTLRHAALPNTFLTQPRWVGAAMSRVLPGKRLMDNVPVSPDVPWEEEMALCSVCRYSFYHVSFFPQCIEQVFRDAVMFDGGDPALIAQWQRHYVSFLKKVQLSQAGRRLLLKNPANTARISILRRLFPSARFIHIHRDPYEVFASTVHLYLKVQAAWGLQSTTREHVIRHVLNAYRVLMEAYLAQKGSLGRNELVEISMSDLESNPIETLRRIYREIELPGFEEAAPLFRRYLHGQRNYQKNQLVLTDEEAGFVRRQWSDVSSLLGYSI